MAGDVALNLGSSDTRVMFKRKKEKKMVGVGGESVASRGLTHRPVGTMVCIVFGRIF